MAVDRTALQNSERDLAMCREACQELQSQLEDLAQKEQQLRQKHEPLKAAAVRRRRSQFANPPQNEQKELRKAVEQKFKEFNHVKSQLGARSLCAS